MEKQHLKILLIEDDPTFVKLVEGVLQSESSVASFQIEHAQSSESGVQAIHRTEPNLIILDLGLPDTRDEETFVKIYEVATKIPIVLLTSNDDESLALRLLKRGAQDYLIKSATDLRLLPRIIQYAIERKRVLEELKDALEKLKSTQAQLIQSEKMESIGKLAIGIAHEVKNPISIVQQCVEFLSFSELSKEPGLKVVIKDMTDAIDRADLILQELLNFATPPDSNMAFSSLNLLLDEAVLLLHREFETRKIAVLKEYDQSLSPVLVNKNRVLQAFVNLILNAVHASKGGGELILKTGLKKKDEITSYQTVDIQDYGSGIAPDVMPKVFEPFFTTKKQEGGTGLGLSIVKNIMEMHHGMVELRHNTNSQGVTATLMFRVPTF